MDPLLPERNPPATTGPPNLPFPETCQFRSNPLEEKLPESSIEPLISGHGNCQPPTRETLSPTSPPISRLRSGRLLSPRSESGSTILGKVAAIKPPATVKTVPSPVEEGQGIIGHRHSPSVSGASDPESGSAKSPEIFNWREGPAAFDSMGSSIPQVYLTSLLPLSALRDVSLFIAGHDDILGTALPSAIAEKLTNLTQAEHDPDESVVSEESDIDREASPAEPKATPAMVTEQDQQPVTPRRGWGLSSFIPATVSRFLPFGRNTVTTPQSATSTDPHNEPRQQYAATEPRRPHVSVTQGSDHIPRNRAPLRAPRTSQIQDSTELTTPSQNIFVPDDLALSQKRTLSRASLLKSRGQEAVRSERRTKRRALEKELEELKKREAIHAEHLKRMENEWLKVKFGGTKTNPYNMRQGRVEEKRLREEGAREEAKIREQEEFAEECRKRAEQYKEEMIAKTTGRKRLRPKSPESIPNPPGCSYGMYDKYFELSSSDEDEPSSPPAKKSRTVGDDLKLKPANFTGSREDYAEWSRRLTAAREADKANSPSKSPLQPTPYGSTNISPSPSRLSQNIFEMDQQKAANRSLSPSKGAKDLDLSSIEEQSEGASYISPDRQQKPEGHVHQNTFTVPDDSDSESDEGDDESPKEPGSATKKKPAGASQAHSMENSGQPADSQKGPSGAEISYIKQRDQALKYAPKTPSRLHQSSRLSASTLASEDKTPRASQLAQDDNEEDDFTVKRSGQWAPNATHSTPTPADRASDSSASSTTPAAAPPVFTPWGDISAQGQATSKQSAGSSEQADPASQGTTPAASSQFGQSFNSNASSTFPTSFGSTFGSSQPTLPSSQTHAEPSGSFKTSRSTSFDPATYDPYAAHRATMSPRAQAYVDSHWRPQDDDLAATNFKTEFEAFEVEANERDNATTTAGTHETVDNSKTLPPPSNIDEAAGPNKNGEKTKTKEQILQNLGVPTLPRNGEPFPYPEKYEMSDRARSFIDAMWGPEAEEAAAERFVDEYRRFCALKDEGAAATTTASGARGAVAV